MLHDIAKGLINCIVPKKVWEIRRSVELGRYLIISA